MWHYTKYLETWGHGMPCPKLLTTDEAKTGQSRAHQGAGPKVAATQSKLLVP